ncbi:hypothetical protein ACFUTR_02160 [Streptomyces sp. NPDC057367]|uniref:hypothetical protein n=1 Tax=Streptomyces sp. NPDC057367 TaxID=3346108 RepID=UPI00363E9BC2
MAEAGIKASTEAEKDYNDALKKQGDFFKAALSAGVAVGSVALVPTAPAGALTGAVAGGFFSEVSGMAVDRLVEGREIDGVLDEALYRTGRELNKAEESSLQQTQWSAADSIDAHKSDLKVDATENLTREANHRGWVRSDSILEDIHARPSA